MNLHFEELTGSDGARLGIASLDAEKSLNALSLPMIQALTERLDAWAKDPNIVCVLLRGNGPRPFARAVKYAAWPRPAVNGPASCQHWPPIFLRPNTASTIACTPTRNR